MWSASYMRAARRRSSWYVSTHRIAGLARVRVLTPRRQPVPGVALQSTERVMHSRMPDAPPWVPPAILKGGALDALREPARFLEIVSDLSPGDAVCDWLQRTTIDRPDVVLLGARARGAALAWLQSLCFDA